MNDHPLTSQMEAQQSSHPQLEGHVAPRGSEESTLSTHSRHNDDEHLGEKENTQTKDARGADVITATAAASAKPTANDASTIPDGGLQAWLQVLGAWMLFFNTWGILNTFGTFQTYYESGELFHESSSNISWIGAIQAFLLLFVGSVSGPFYDRGHLRILLMIGSFFVSFGYMMTSICKTYWQVVLAQGFCIGIGGGCLFVPAIALLPTYFRRKLGLAVGVAASGSSTGGVIYPIVFYRLIGRIGFGWTTRVLGFIVIATLIIPLTVMKMRVVPAKARALIDPSAFTDLPFLIFVFGCFIGFIDLYVFTFFVSYFGQQQGITDTNLTFYLIPILNAASIFGRTIPNAVSDYVGTLNIIGPGALMCGILSLSMLAVHSVGGIVVEAIFFGFFSGVFVALPPVCFAILTKDKTKIGTRIGMGFGFISTAVLVGGPGAGAILGTNATNPQWSGFWIFGGVVALAAAFIFILLRMWTAGWKLMVKI